MDIDRETILVLNEPIKCSKCNCDCHCDSELHTPNDELDTGGPCVYQDCRCKGTDRLDEDSFNGA